MYQKSSNSKVVVEKAVPAIEDLDKELRDAREINSNLKKKLEIARLEKENRDMIKEISMLENDTNTVYF